MIQFMRSLFSWGDATDNRTVVGAPVDVDLKAVALIKNSNDRLTELSQLVNRYTGTPHEAKLKAVHEKTKKIHAYLVEKKRVHELEIFHLQNTEHFINTFRIILEAYQKEQEESNSRANRSAKPGGLPEKSKFIKNKQNQETYRSLELVKPVAMPESLFQSNRLAPVPQLNVPSISINTFATITYYKEDADENLIAREIGFTSTDLEKAAFLQHVTACLGIRGIAYMGNALVSIANNNGSQPTGLVPIIHWEGFLYALNLNDYRLFPVQINRR
ncbi:hypothetical protein HUW51_13675 [Adhaeribacter swui]|uniref:Uncharacterized protein n=1 Tax=Adhaeribacter swui TaxID=2086471 RepID=A0A7G7G984_9BACT|nr:hypothetical protein [Adhaeribacter swui]QNF33718.1 hypothetical protein HUW51_13675 [Adhaeribacter swui]